VKKLHKILEARTASLEWGEVGEQNEYDKKKQANPYNNCGAGGKPSLFLGNVLRLVILGVFKWDEEGGSVVFPCAERIAASILCIAMDSHMRAREIWRADENENSHILYPSVIKRLSQIIRPSDNQVAFSLFEPYRGWILPSPVGKERSTLNSPRFVLWIRS